MKNKNCNKVSIITDNKFIPIDIQIFKGNLNDSNILQQQFMNIDTYMNYSKYFIADKGYCSSKIRKLLISKNILPIIPYNKRLEKFYKKTFLSVKICLRQIFSEY
jgi:transposase